MCLWHSRITRNPRGAKMLRPESSFPHIGPEVLLALAGVLGVLGVLGS